MKIISNLITKQEIDSVSGDDWIGNSYVAYTSKKLCIEGSVLIFDNYCDEANSTEIKIITHKLKLDIIKYWI